MMPDDPFSLESFQNPYLAEGGDRVDAIVSVTAGQAVAAPGPSTSNLLLGFIIDTSGSMEGERIDAVRNAVNAAIDLLADDDRFFVVSFANYGRVVATTQAATAAAKTAAQRAVNQLAAQGGTAMSQGLSAARSLFANTPGAIAQCLFLTDGKNESEHPEDVARELTRCAGLFECDCWGVGTEWQVGEVQEIARTLLGKASLIPSADGIESAFRDAVGKAQSKAVKDVRLRVWTPAGAEIAACKQVSPAIEDYTARAITVGPQTRDYLTGAWAAGESRDYQITVRVPAGRVGDEMLAARPSIVYPDPSGNDAEVKAPGARVFAHWTEDEALSSRLDATVAHYNGQDELAAAIQGGLQARERGDEATATEMLGNAVRLAHAGGNDEMTTRLRKVVEIVDAEHGTVRLKRAVAKEATMDLELESTTTRRARRAGAGGGPSEKPSS